MSKTKIILASTLSVLAVAGVTTAAVVVTMKNKKQSDSPKKGNEGNQVVVANDSKFEYDLNTDQTKELSAKLLLVKGQDVTVTLSENNVSKTIKTKVKEDGTVDFSNLKDGKTYKVTKIVVKDGDKERDLIAEVKEPKEKPGNDVQPGGTAKPTDPTNGDGKKPGNATNPAEPNQGDDPSVSGGSAGGDAAGKETPGQAGGDAAGKETPGQAGGEQDSAKKVYKLNKPISVKWDKVTGIITYTFKSNAETYNFLKNKKITLKIDAKKYVTDNDIYPAAKWTVGSETTHLKVEDRIKHPYTFSIETEYTFKKGFAQEDAYTLKAVYADNDTKTNLLEGPYNTTVDVKF
ncbi:DUF1410 domain-containing protein [Mycoplasmopsis bovigenitalium]|uniref:DUF1410 domain-containing protein n=1 Tax=Mycoplasmopsis bovigenitalium TaxID=2112 RepID=UPI00039E3C9E|nr:DUF1410 domain-containing protein [Mycoplasmopsis bovigenitalium]